MSSFFNKSFCLEVWGDFACFTRPEMKVERVSYDVPTPSAVRAIFESIFWKPAVRWQVEKIEVLKPVEWISVRRNEVGLVMSDRSDGLFIEDNRQQRAGLLLRDVQYRLHAQLVFIPERERVPSRFSIPEALRDDGSSRGTENPGKYNAIFERRAQKGQCFNQPYLGCREFSCAFRLIDDPAGAAVAHPAIDETRDLGFMLFDLYDHDGNGAAKAAFFRPLMEKGVITVPHWDSEEVRK